MASRGLGVLEGYAYKRKLTPIVKDNLYTYG